MLKGFALSNYKSFNSIQHISMSAGKIAHHSDHIIEAAGEKILKSAIIYGANAGGKSSFIKGVAFSRHIILFGIDNTNISNCYFRINSNNYNKPAIFQYDLIIDNQEFSYGIVISYSKQKIISEWLIKINNNSEFVIFNRNNEDNSNSVETDIHLKNNDRLKIYFDDFGSNISEGLSKKSMLSDIALRNNGENGYFDEINKVYRWFQNLLILFPESKYNNVNEIASDDQNKQFFEKMLNYFDTGIEDISEQNRPMDFDKLFSGAPHKFLEEIKTDIEKRISKNKVLLHINDQAIYLQKNKDGELIYHKLILDHGNKNEPFEYMDESDGTKRLFDLIPLLYNDNVPRVILIDEIDRSLHTSLVRKFIELFLTNSGNGGSQLIATTHDTNLMDLKLLRQDEIWFVDRGDDHSSKLYSLNKFKARFDKIVKNEYLLGRYGAIPVFKESLDIPEENADDQ